MKVFPIGLTIRFPSNVAFVRVIACLVLLYVALSSSPSVFALGIVDTYAERAFKHEQKHDYANALRNYDAAVQRVPHSANAYYYRGGFYLRRHDYLRAIKDFDVAIRLEPTLLQYANARAGAYAHMGNYARAMNEYNHLLTLSPWGYERGMILNSRAWLEAVCPDSKFRNGQAALADAKQACAEEGWRESDYLDTLAAAYAETGDFESAIKYQEKALARENKENPLDNGKTRLTLYRQHRPYREKD